MVGALLQLVARGSDDIYLIKDPQITLFKMVYRRHVNFSIYDLEKLVKAKNTFGVNFQEELDKCGDLLHKVYLIVELPEFNLKNIAPTCENIKMLLAEYGIIWNTDIISDYNIITSICPDIITLQYYNEQLIQVINEQIRKNVDLYNFFSNGKILSTSPNYLKKSSQEVLSRALDSTFNYVQARGNGLTDYSIWKNMLKQIRLMSTENKLSNGPVGSLMLLAKIMTNYSQEYSPVYTSTYYPNILSNKYIVASDASGVNKNIIMLFSELFRNGYSGTSNIVFNTGILLQTLMNYYYDTTILTINGEMTDVNHGTIKIAKNKLFTSNSLFGELLNRPFDSCTNEIVEFQLYDKSDIQNVFYISLMYNLTRLWLNATPPPYKFQLDHDNVYINDILPPINIPELLGVYNHVSKIDENIIFYHVIDPSIAGFNLNFATTPATTPVAVSNIPIASNISINVSAAKTSNTSIQIYLQNFIEKKYQTIGNYKEVFPFYNPILYTNLDSYKIYHQYIAQNKDNINVNDVANLALYNIQYNIQYNLALIRNMMTVFNNSQYTNESHYRFSYYKRYRSNMTQTHILVNGLNSTFQNNSDSEINTFNDSIQNNLNDQFERIIRSNKIVNGEYFLTVTDRFGIKTVPNITPLGTPITNFFSNKISAEIADFRVQSDSYINLFERLGYMIDFRLWKRGIFDLGNTIQEVYTAYVSPNDPQYNVQNSFSNQYKKIAIMNYIPFLAARDIPDMIYYLYSTIPKIKEVLGTKFNAFLEAIDFRDNNLNHLRLATKTQIYQRMINAVIGANNVLIDENHFNQMVDTFSNGGFLLAQSFRPETLLPQYSINDENGNLIDIGEMYLPIEWVTQTYYHILLDKIDEFFAENSLDDVDKNNFILLLKSIINCYVVYTNQNNFPTYTDYQRNGYILLGLLPETSLAPSDYLVRLPSDFFTVPTYSDASSTIWYQLFKKYILSYNQLLNNTVISKSYYENNVGSTMSSIFDYFRHVVNGTRTFDYYYNNKIKDTSINQIGIVNTAILNQNESISVILNESIFGAKESLEERILLNFGEIGVLKNKTSLEKYDETYGIPEGSNSLSISYINNPGYQNYVNFLVFLNNANYYHDSVNVYVNKILETYNLEIEPYPPLIMGFDFYRLRTFDNNKNTEMTNFINDYITVFNNSLKHYNDYSSILKFNTDTNLVFNNGVRDIADVMYEESEKIIDYLSENIAIKYINAPLNSFSNTIAPIDELDHPMNDVIGAIITPLDIIGYAFSVIDDTLDFGIGLGVNGYLTGGSIQMYRNNSEQSVRITNDNINYDFVPYTQNPIYDKSDIYYVFQNNITKEFSVYESKNPNPLIVITIADSARYAILANMLENSANLFIKGNPVVKYYTAKYAYTQVIDGSNVQNLINSVTKWFYIGAEDIQPFDDGALSNINYVFHKGYLDQNIIKKLDVKLFDIDKLNSVSQAINPNSYNNVYNLDGIHATVTNSQGDEIVISYNTSLYGILDSIYNTHLTGNMNSTFKLMQLDLPANKIFTNFITNDNNPFYSYSLYDSFIGASSNVNYDNYMLKNEEKTLTPSNLLTYNDAKQISKLFDDTIHQSSEIIHVLEDLQYVKQNMFINTQLSTIVVTTGQTTVTTTDKYDHVFSTNNDSITGISINNTQFYGMSFTIKNIFSDNDSIEIGFLLNSNDKIVIRKNGQTSYDVLLQYENSKTVLLFERNPNFSFGATYTFLVFDSNVPTTTINSINSSITDPSQQVSKNSIQIYENFTLLLNQTIDPATVYINLFTNATINIFIYGRISVTFNSKSYALQRSTTTIRSVINSGAIWLSMNDAPAFISISNYKFKNVDKKETNFASATILANPISADYMFLPDAITDNGDIIGFAFEVTNVPQIIGIGLGYFSETSSPLNNKIKGFIEIHKNNNMYTLNVNNVDSFILPNEISFGSGNIILCIQNNKEGKFSIYKYNGGIEKIYELTFANSNEYEKLVYSIFNNKVNLLVTTNESAKINFYTARYIFDQSNVENKVLIGEITKWLYIGALNTSPITKIVSVSHHKFETGLTPSIQIYEQIFVTPVNGLPSVQQPQEFLSTIPSSIVTIDNFDYSDVILNDIDPVVKMIGDGISNSAGFPTKIYSMAFSIINNSSDFSVGFFSWLDTNIMFNKTANNYSIIINSFNFSGLGQYQSVEILIGNLKIDASDIFYAFQNNEDNTFTLYKGHTLIIKITTDIPEYDNLLFQPVPPYYGTLKTMSTIGVSGSDAIIRFYSNKYANQFAPVSIRNILLLKDNDKSNKINWFGSITVENSNINNTSDYKIIGVNNTSLYLNPPFLIPNDGMLGFSFTIADHDLNTNELKIGLVDNTVFDAIPLIEIQIYSDKTIIFVNNIDYNIGLLTFASNNMYYVFYDDATNKFSFYENNRLIFSINVDNNQFHNNLYLYLSGKMDFRLNNAPYSYSKATIEEKIMIDNSSIWLSLGGGNTGPIRHRRITSKKLYTDPVVDILFSDQLGTLSNFSLVTLYTYFQVVKDSPLQTLIDLRPFVENVDQEYGTTINNLKEYISSQIKKNFDALTRITSISFEGVDDSRLFINGFNTFLDNSYKVYPLDYHNFDTATGVSTHVYHDGYYRSGFADYQLNYQMLVNFFMPTINGSPNGIIQTDLEKRLLKLVMNELPRFAWVKELGHKIIKEVTVLVGDQVVETHTSDLLHLMHELKINPDLKRGYDNMIGNTLEMHQYSSDIRSIKKLYIPLYFWFCDNPGSALPMISLLHTKITLDFKIESINNLLYIEKDSFIYGIPKIKYSLLCQYIYLDEEERHRMAASKLEYLIEKYNYNGKDIITRNTNFTQPVINGGVIVNNFILNNTPNILALQNLVYHIHADVSGDGTIEPFRIGVTDFREVITRNSQDYLFTPTFGFSQNKIIGFSFRMISYPEVNPNNASYDSNLIPPNFGIGLSYDTNEFIDNKIITTHIGTLELTKNNIVITNLLTQKKTIVNYIIQPQFRGGALIDVYDVYVGVQDNVNRRFLLYENSILIAEIDDNNNNAYNDILLFTKQSPSSTTLFERLSLYVYGPIRVLFYNAKYPYNNAKRALRKIIDDMTDWLYVGGDNTPMTDVLNYQEVQIHDPPTESMIVMGFGTEIKITKNGDYLCQPSVIVNNNSLIGFAFSLDYESPLLSYDLEIGLSTNNGSGFVQMRKVGNMFDIVVNDGINTSSVNYLKDPILFVQDTIPLVQNKLYRPNIVFTLIQDNISKTFTIFEENKIIGQVDGTSKVYGNLIKLFNNEVNIKFDVNNLVNGPLIINFFTSEAVLENHAKLNLRRVINNVTDWISFVPFKPLFYVPSFRNIETKIIDDVSNKGRITNMTSISSDIVLDKYGDYLLRPSQISDATQMVAFSFSILDPNLTLEMRNCTNCTNNTCTHPSYNFSIGITQFSNTSNSIMLKKSGDYFYLEIKNIKLVTTLGHTLEQFTKKLSRNQKISKTFGDTVQISTTSCIEIGRNLIFGEDEIYTIIQDNALGIFTLFKHEQIIGQVTLSNPEYSKLLIGLQFGVNILIKGGISVRFYTADYIYNTLTNILHNYLERVDRWYFVRKIINSITNVMIPYEPTPVPVRIRLDDPIKFFIWYMKAYDNTTHEPIDIINWNRYGFDIRNIDGDFIKIHPIFENMRIEMYGLDREKPREENYFTRVIPWARGMQSISEGEYIYSFALHPMLLQPTGTCNYSEIDESRFVINFTNEVENIMRGNKNIRIELELWGRAYNILRVASGMGGLLFYR
jgi:hypothetical protein